MDKNKLIEEAMIARKKSYSPYSNMAVGAAVFTETGKIYRGCNIENKITAARVCAERTAIFSAFVNDEKIKAISIIGDTEGPIEPCDFCKFVLLEMCNKDTVVIMSNLKGDVAETVVGDLKPAESSKKMLSILVNELRKNSIKR
ncbi:cytidine deaminase [Bacillus cereus group sp. N21]|uniref:cytidine deaminase n=1 Tax=Bacillus cereus group sp. N21 TaxID=2794591 RepID=UPI0018F71AE3|nr:cytidine deaminase [Bacillus cereus group sp. N21]